MFLFCKFSKQNVDYFFSRQKFLQRVKEPRPKFSLVQVLLNFIYRPDLKLADIRLNFTGCGLITQTPSFEK